MDKAPGRVMASVTSGISMTFGGTLEPAASLRLVSFGKLDDESNKVYTTELTEMVKATYGVEPVRCFIEFSPIESHMVARGGKTLKEALALRGGAYHFK